MIFRIGLLAFAALLAAPSALACSCLCTTTGEKTDWVAEATYIFTGSVLSVEKHGDPLEGGYETIRMSVSKLAKGAPVSIINLRSPISSGGSCGVGFRKGDTHNTIAFLESDGHLWVGQCSQYCARNAGAFKSLQGDQ